MKVSEKPCKDCPFKNTSIPGFLADYTVEDFLNMYTAEFPFPCHTTLQKDLTLEETVSSVYKEEVNLCRGYIEGMIKSGKLPRDSNFKKLLDQIRGEGLNDNTMTIWNFVKHHNNKLK